MGDLRLGERVPSDTALLTHLEDAGCAQWRPVERFTYPDEGRAFNVFTRDERDDGAIVMISINSPEIPTKSGTRVGDTEQSLLERYPDIGKPVSPPDGGTIYVIKGNAGKVLFVVYDGAVVSLQLVPISAPVPYDGEGTNCGGA